MLSGLELPRVVSALPTLAPAKEQEVDNAARRFSFGAGYSVVFNPC